jgi:hypothetical protein
MKSQKTIPDKSNAISTFKLELSNADRLKEFSLAIGLVILGIGFSLLPNPVKAGTEDIRLYYRYVPYEGPGASVGKPAQQPGKQASGASGAEARKTEQAPSQAEKSETANPPAKEGQGTQTGAAKQAQPAQQSGTPSTSESAPAKMTEQAGSQGGKSETAAPLAKEGTGAQTEGAKQAQSAQQTGKSSESSGTSPAQSAGQEPTGAAASGSQAPVPCPHQQSLTQQKAESPIATEQQVGEDKRHNPVGKPGNQSGAVPSFCQVDANKDHYITKDELQNFPDLLKVFDKVDAGKDGRLEQHEFQNLEMETKREGEIM